MESQLLPVLVRVAETRTQWLEKQGIPSYWLPVEKGVQATLEYLEEKQITSITEEGLKAVWHESEQEAVDEIVALIHQGIDVNSPDEGAALCHAAKHDLINVVSLLLERSPDVATHDEDGVTALHYAARYGNTEVISLLLEYGADVAATDNVRFVFAADTDDYSCENSKTALHYAADDGLTKVVSVLLEHGADVAAIDNDGVATLHCAARYGHTKVVSVLWEHGADVAAIDRDGKTALHYAARYGNTEVVSLLLEYGADVAAIDNNSKTALHYAADNGLTKVVSLLLEYGADVAATDNDGVATLHCAARYGHTKVVSVLWEHGADVAAIDRDGKTALHYAARYGNTEVISLLLEYGADVAAIDRNGKTALHCCADDGLTKVVSLLLEHGADVAAIDRDGKTALHYAAVNGLTKVVSLLLEHGADVAAIDRDGKTALHYAARYDHTVVSLLLEYGAGVAATDNDGLTVLHHGVTCGCPEVVNLLLDRGADVHALTKEGYNALGHMILVKRYNPDDDYLAVIRLLCSQKQKIELPSSTQKSPLEKHQLGMLACAQYWQDHHEKNQKLLEVPSEVVKNGEDAVKSYLAELEKTDASKLVYRRKICVVGPSTWGKTSLIRSMAEGVPVDISLANRTTGIDLFSLEFREEGGGNEETVTHHDVTFWDFAGQEIYHVAHAVFFSERTLYLVCIDLQAYDEMFKQTSMKSMVGRNVSRQRFFEDQILRWMILVLFRQPDAQFKLIGTKHDKISASARIEAVNDIKIRLKVFLEDSSGIVQITGDMENTLKHEFNQEILTASVTSVKSIQKVKEAIKDAVINNRGLSFPMPEAHTKVLQYIYHQRSATRTAQQDRMDQVIVSVNELCGDLMKIPGLQNTDCREILRVLHELGDVLWYETDEFKDWIILDPTVMLDLVREVVNHKYEVEKEKRYNALWADGTLPHSLLVTFPSWKRLDSMDETGEMVHLLKRLLHDLNLVYPVNDMERIDKADIIVPMYWKAREKAKKALKPLTKQNTILEQNFGGSSYIAKWRYSLPIAISEAVFVNFVVKCYRPYVHREVRETHFESSVHGEFHAAIYIGANEKYDDITIEVAASTKKLAWAEMMYFIIDMESILKTNYPGLTKCTKLQRFVVDDQGNDRDLNLLIACSVDEARLRQTKAPWLPPDFDWFIRRAWEKPDVFDKYRLLHRVEVLKKLVVTKDERRLPALWSLAYPKKGEHVEIRVHSDFSGKCWHDPLKIQITDNFFTNHSQFFQVGISVLSIVSGAIPIPLASEAVVQVLTESKVALDQATTVKAVLDRAHLGPGEEKSSNELGMGLAEREEFLLALLAEHSQPLNKRTIGDACELCRVATGDGQYLWVNQQELNELGEYIKCEPEPCTPINPKTISLRITGATGSWDAKIFTKMYCEWKLSDVMKNSEVISDTTKKAAITSTGATWGSNVTILNIGSIKELRDCTLHVCVKQTRRLTGCFRDDKEMAKGEKQLDIRVDEDCSKTQTIDVSIDMGEARTVECQIKVEF